MADAVRVNTEEMAQVAPTLRAGQRVLLSGVCYTSRDAAHKRITQMLDKGERPPYDLQGAAIYYAGPTPAPEGLPIGSCGPTTSGRMDAYAPRLLALGLAGMAGKGARSEAVVQAMREHTAVYFAAAGGAGAAMAACVESAAVVCYEDLGSEAVRRLLVRDMPLTVAIDCTGKNLYEEGPAAYLAACGQSE